MKFSPAAIGIFLAGSMIAAAAMASADPSVPEKPTRSHYDELLDKTAHDQDETHQINLKHMERVEKDTERTEKHMERVEQDTERLEKNLDRQEADIARYEKILGIWERQQAEYQKYLDSLHK